MEENYINSTKLGAYPPSPTFLPNMPIRFQFNTELCQLILYKTTIATEISVFCSPQVLRVIKILMAWIINTELDTLLPQNCPHNVTPRFLKCIVISYNTLWYVVLYFLLVFKLNLFKCTVCLDYEEDHFILYLNNLYLILCWNAHESSIRSIRDHGSVRARGFKIVLLNKKHLRCSPVAVVIINGFHATLAGHTHVTRLATKVYSYHSHSSNKSAPLRYETSWARVSYSSFSLGIYSNYLYSDKIGY